MILKTRDTRKTMAKTTKTTMAMKTMATKTMATKTREMDRMNSLAKTMTTQSPAASPTLYLQATRYGRSKTSNMVPIGTLILIKDKTY